MAGVVSSCPGQGCAPTLVRNGGCIISTMASTLTAYFLVFVYLASDSFFRTGAKARSLSRDESDRKSTNLLVASMLVSILFLFLAPLLNAFHLAPLEGPAGWIGILLMLLGIGLRLWATRVLGRFYTRTLLTDAGHRIVQEGPYRLVRHPGYTGSLLVWIGAGLAASNWIAFSLVTLICCASYLYRIKSEEAMLVARFGKDYQDYIQRTKRLIPFIY